MNFQTWLLFMIWLLVDGATFDELPKDIIGNIAATLSQQEMATSLLPVSNATRDKLDRSGALETIKLMRRTFKYGASSDAYLLAESTKCNYEGVTTFIRHFKIVDMSLLSRMAVRAVASNCQKLVGYLIGRGVSPQYRDERKLFNLLAIAVIFDHFELAATLRRLTKHEDSSRPADVHDVLLDSYDKAPTLLFKQRRCHVIITWVLCRGLWEHGHLLLSSAIFRQDFLCVRYFIASTVLSPGSLSNALGDAFKAGDLELMSLFLAAGANVNQSVARIERFTVLFPLRNIRKPVKMLIYHKLDLGTSSLWLRSAVQEADLWLLKFLIEKGAGDPDGSAMYSLLTFMKTSDDFFLELPALDIKALRTYDAMASVLRDNFLYDIDLDFWFSSLKPKRVIFLFRTLWLLHSRDASKKRLFLDTGLALLQRLLESGKADMSPEKHALKVLILRDILKAIVRTAPRISEYDVGEAVTQFGLTWPELVKSNRNIVDSLVGIFSFRPRQTVS